MNRTIPIEGGFITVVEDSSGPATTATMEDLPPLVLPTVGLSDAVLLAALRWGAGLIALVEEDYRRAIAEAEAEALAGDDYAFYCPAHGRLDPEDVDSGPGGGRYCAHCGEDATEGPT